jgi:citrate lyase gamma subunit
MTSMIKEKLAKDLMSSDSTINITAMQYYRKEYKMEIQDSNLQKQYAAYIQKSIENAKQSAESAKTNTNK